MYVRVSDYCSLNSSCDNTFRHLHKYLAGRLRNRRLLVRAQPGVLWYQRTYVKLAFDKNVLSEIMSEIDGPFAGPSASHPVCSGCNLPSGDSLMHYHVPKPFYRKSRNTWYVELNGRQVNLGNDRDDAFQRYHEIMASPPSDREARSTPSGDGVRLTELFDRFLAWVHQHRAADTYEWYRYRLQRFADRFPSLTLSQLRPFHVQEWVDSYPEHSPTTTRNYMRSIKRCIKWAQGLGYIDSNPIEHLSVPMGCPKDTYVSPEEFAELLRECRDDIFRDLLQVTYETGCRPQESLRLEIRHLDLVNQRWVLPRSEAKGKEAPRVVYLSEKAVTITRRLIEGRSHGYVFRNSRGKPWKKNSVNCAFKRIQHRMGMSELKRRNITVCDDEIAAFMLTLSPTRREGKQTRIKTEAELRCEAKRKLTYRMAQEFAPKYSLYALRHSWATNALQRGVDALTVAILMGHKDPSQLAKVYQHLSHNPKHLLEQAKKAAS
jgi:integrase